MNNLLRIILAFFLNALIVIPLFSNCTDKEIVNVEDDVHAAAGKIQRTGIYASNGDYMWTYSIPVTILSGKSGSLEVVVSDNTSPFTIEVEDPVIDLESGVKPVANILVKVPASLIKEEVNLTKYTCKVEVSVNKKKIFSQKINLTFPLPEHPRLLVRAGDLEQIRKNFEHPDFNELREVYYQQLNYDTDGVINTDKPDEKVRQKMEALALAYLLDPVKEKDKGLEAIKIALNYLSSYSDHRKDVQTGYSENLRTYEAVFGAAMVYDWCYDLLTDMDKRGLIEYMKRVCLLAEYGIPDGSLKQYLSGHYGEYAPSVSLAMGIAIYDEEPDMFEMSYKEQVEGFAPSRNRMIPSGTHHQGAQYIHVRGSNELLQHFIMNKLNCSPYDPDIYLMTYRAIFGIIPQKTDMDGMTEGDCHNHVEMGNSQLYYLSANLSDDPYLQDMSRRMLMNTAHQSARVFIYHDPSKPSASIEEAPKARFFPSPSGIMMARTAWDIDKTGYDSDAMVVLMNMREYSAQNHTHMDLGHFSIYYKGQLALDAGIYQGADAQNGWGKENFVNYYSRTIAHNSLLILDPNEPTPVAGWNVKTKSRDGGQFFKAPHAWDNSDEMFEAGPSATILAHEIAPGTDPDYTYFKGDITEAYKVPKYIAEYPSKVDVVRRSFVFLNHKSEGMPGSLIILDKVVSTDPSFKKTWLLHTQNEPSVQGNVIINQSTQGGRNGKLVTNVLLPEQNNQKIELVGGPGKEYWVDGHNYGTVTQEDAGCWRIELSPETPSLSDNFLNVVQAMETSREPRSVNKVLSADKKYVAVEVGNNIVAQNLDLTINNQSISFEIGQENQIYKVMITDLEEGQWVVTTAADKFSASASINGVLVFESKGGKFNISKVSE